MLDTDDGWAKDNIHYWRRDFDGYLRFFFSQCFTEPHSTKQIEDCVGWGHEIGAETLILGAYAEALTTEETLDLCGRVRCPVLVVVGDGDAVTGDGPGIALAEAIEGATLISVSGGGHVQDARDPVFMNLLIRDFVASLDPEVRSEGGAPPALTRRTPSWTRSLSRRRRALYLSSPIGLGHARRDVAIADELRTLHPDLEIDWLAQHPVTDVLEARGERVHPASAWLASESAHIEAEAASTTCTPSRPSAGWTRSWWPTSWSSTTWSRPSEYDLVIGDEAWDVDHFLHENPELKRTAFAWMTDFVGWLPMPDGGEREAFLTADYNAEMIEHVARFPRAARPLDLRRRPGRHRARRVRAGPAGSIREWTERALRLRRLRHRLRPRGARATAPQLRRELGYRADERVCVVTVGGSGVGEAAAAPGDRGVPGGARAAVPGLRMVVVTGTADRPGGPARAAASEVRAYVPDCYRHLVAARPRGRPGRADHHHGADRQPAAVPLLPAGHHFEQNFHVAPPARPLRRRAGAWTTRPRTRTRIAEAIATEIDREVDYRPVEPRRRGAGGGAASPSCSERPAAPGALGRGQAPRRTAARRCRP